MPEIEHHDLVLFADQKVNLKKDEVDDQRAQVNRLRDRIEAKIAVTPGYGLVKSLHAGSVAKGTALSSVNDRDLAVYVRAEQARWCPRSGVKGQLARAPHRDVMQPV